MKPLKPAILLILLLPAAFLSFTAKRSPSIGNPADIKNMVFIPAGTFMMGLDSAGLQLEMKRFNQPATFFSQEFPANRVTVRQFYIDKYDVTNSEFKKFINANPQWAKGRLPDSLQDGNYLKDWNGNKYPKGQGSFPVTYVSFYAASAYAHWVRKRLPTESEWEFTAKGVSHNSITFTWGDADASPDNAAYINTSQGHTVKVGSFPPNSLGIYDMAGNVYQFCEDRWRPDQYAKMARFAKNRSFSPFTVLQPNVGVIRGGSWNDPPEKLRTTYRVGYAMNKCTALVGFRCAANAEK